MRMKKDRDKNEVKAGNKRICNVWTEVKNGNKNKDRDTKKIRLETIEFVEYEQK